MGGAGRDSLAGGDGSDTASYEDSDAGVTIDLGATAPILGRGGHAAGDTLAGIENLVGSAHADRLEGDNLANKLVGGAGNDTLLGGDGNDTLLGGDGNDSLEGGDGSDYISFEDSSSGVTFDLGGASGADYHFDIENVKGSRGNDRLTGDEVNNILDGEKGDDTLDGAGGTGTGDTLIGGEGNDTASYASATSAVTISLVGQASNTTLQGGEPEQRAELTSGSASNHRIALATDSSVTPVLWAIETRLMPEVAKRRRARGDLLAHRRLDGFLLRKPHKARTHFTLPVPTVLSSGQQCPCMR